MEKEFEKKYHSLEKDHWWFISRRNIIRRIVKKYDKSIKILEIGCSSGRLINILNEEKFKDLTGIDISNEAVQLCGSEKVASVFQMDGSEMGFKERKFDLIIASDILEHINDDLHAVSEWERVLREGGIILAFVPAFKFLWSDHDIVNRHFRRYNKRELISLFEKNGFKVLKISYWNFLLFFPIFIKRIMINKILKSYKPKGDLFRMPRITDLFFVMLLSIENIFCSFFNLPLGLSLFIIAKK